MEEFLKNEKDLSCSSALVQTEISIGKNKIKAAAFSMLKKRCFIKSTDEEEDMTDEQVEALAEKKIDGYERWRAIYFRKLCSGYKDVVAEKDKVIAEKNQELKKEKKEHTKTSREFRFFRNETAEEHN